MRVDVHGYFDSKSHEFGTSTQMLKNSDDGERLRRAIKGELLHKWLATLYVWSALTMILSSYRQQSVPSSSHPHQTP